MKRKSENFEFGAVQEPVNLIDLEKCRKIRLLFAKIGFDTAENGSSKVSVTNRPPTRPGLKKTFRFIGVFY